MGQYYSVPYIAPAVQPDDPASGVPSDHDMAVAEPLAGAGTTHTREYRVKTSRPMPDSSVRLFGQWIQGIQWDELLTGDMTPTQQAETMEKMFSDKVDNLFPVRSCRVSNSDLPYITAEIKKLDKYVKKEYKLKGKSEKYLKLKSIYDCKMTKAASDHLNKYVRDLKEQAPGKAYQAMRRMAARPGDWDDFGSFTLTSHLDNNLSPKQCVDKMANYFSSISKEYQPISFELLPIFVQVKLTEKVQPNELPTIYSFEIWNKMKAGKKTKSAVPWELPARLRHEFGPELTTPATIIFNNIIQTGEWVTHWKHEWAIPLKKLDIPIDEGDVRLIAITPYLSLQMEKFVLMWLCQYIGHKLDRDQFGGAGGHSIAHYLIEVMNFVLYNQDLSESLATFIITIDIHKGFNKICHVTTLTRLAEMGAPGWLLKIIFSYLSNRTMSIR